MGWVDDRGRERTGMEQKRGWKWERQHVQLDWAGPGWAGGKRWGDPESEVSERERGGPSEPAACQGRNSGRQVARHLDTGGPQRRAQRSDGERGTTAHQQLLRGWSQWAITGWLCRECLPRMRRGA